MIAIVIMTNDCPYSVALAPEDLPLALRQARAAMVKPYAEKGTNINVWTREVQVVEEVKEESPF